jgi:subfamily B ATP-binding cassette protein MsbA
MNSKQLFRRLMRYSLRYWYAFAVATIAMSVAAASETAFPALMKILMDEGFAEKSDFPLWWAPAGIIAVFLSRGVATFISNYTMSWMSHNVLRDIRTDLYEKLLYLPTTYFDNITAGALIAKLISDVQLVLTTATNVVTTLIRDTLVLIGLVGWLLWINWQLTLVLLSIVPLLAYLTQKFSKRMRDVSRNYLQTVSDMTGNVEQTIAGHRVLKTYNAQPAEQQRFEAINSAHRAQGLRLAIASALQAPATQLIAAIGVAIVVTIALAQTREGQNTIGDFLSFITAMIMMLNPLRHLADINSQLQRGLAAAEGLFRLIDEKTEPIAKGGHSTHISGDICFGQVTFAYEGRSDPALRNICFTLPTGGSYAFVGASGSGKTSIISLIPRLYDPQSGAILIGGRDIRTMDLHELRMNIALVSQDPILFNGTIEENIRIANRTATGKQLSEAVIGANLENVISSLPDGIKTRVGDRGVKLSGGQRQKVSIARAFLKDAPILILDEATSSLDNDSEREIQRSIDRLREGRTTLIIAHRLSTVVSCDRIYVIESGSVRCFGTHNQLLESDSVYRNLYSKEAEVC